ncbi:hypothetical protein Q73_09385 [Bacillus coahuilensis m2-6]|uniref:Uncharacterized protein n=1 Tax=Bacillus coahuilensis p1.1.43 TaxID=1150625 RepID=A0A147K7J8_9BACI|nr:hypothetical protein [Bacillus coahuilensis]KUP05984.1 hypothetical protein Q75_09970 [Bacillus coahuilensis p1.1.43]KUP07416.1 hypothetical protein Q73_09385 [Bacillus coahuilensis m2-6]
MNYYNKCLQENTLYGIEAFLLKQNQLEYISVDKKNKLSQNIDITLDRDSNIIGEELTFCISNNGAYRDHLEIIFLLELSQSVNSETSFVSPIHSIIWHQFDDLLSLQCGWATKGTVTLELVPLDYLLVHGLERILQNKHMYFPLSNQKSCSIVRFSMQLGEFEEAKGSIGCLTGHDRDELLNFHYAIKNTLAFPLQK